MANLEYDRLKIVIEKIDAANALDPNRELVDGQEIAKELLYSYRMTDELLRFAPNASVHLQIAARAQHIERWTSQRTNYPEGRAGYKKWRSQLMLFHAQRTGELMQEAGYAATDIERVQYLIKKRALGRDPETQVLEDVICLVFVKYYLESFAKQHATDKLVDIIQKTWVKMSAQGQASALSLELPADLLELVTNALQPET